jgi:hypothetical protein
MRNKKHGSANHEEESNPRNKARNVAAHNECRIWSFARISSAEQDRNSIRDQMRLRKEGSE